MGIKRDLIVAERRRDVAQMYLSGYTQAEIAHKWKVSQPQISYDLKHIHAEWVQAARMSMDEAKARELARIDRLEREYWQAWQRSIGQRERTLTERTTGEKAHERAQVVKEDNAGESKYLDGVRWCIEQRLKIFGVYAAEKYELSWRQAAQRDGLSEDEANELYSRMVDAARTRMAETGGGGSVGGSETTDGE